MSGLICLRRRSTDGGSELNTTTVPRAAMAWPCQRSIYEAQLTARTEPAKRGKATKTTEDHP